jgi:hypothetical protein
MMPGIKLEKVRDALADAYDEDSLEQMLRTRLNKRLFNIVARAPLETVAYKLLEKADMQGWDVDLIREAQRFNPGHPGLRQVYEQYGMAPEIRLTKGNVEVGGADVRVSGQGFERIVREDNAALDIVMLRTRISDFEVRVCRVDLNDEAAGTGFLIGPDVILTNYHVVEKVLDGTWTEAALSCLFDFKVLVNGTVQKGSRLKLHAGGGILAHSPYTDDEKMLMPDRSVPGEDHLDYALLRLERSLGSEAVSAGAGAPPRGWEVLPTVLPALAADQGIIIAQHPQGSPMKLAVDTRSVIGLNTKQTRVRYRTNTEGGSSGSPVFDMQCRLVALHHYGDPARHHPAYNQGVAPLHLIRQQIADAGRSALLGG